MTQEYKCLSGNAILALRGLHQKFKLTTFLTKLLHNVNTPILKYLCKFQVDILTNARVVAVQNLEDVYTFILRQLCW